LLHNVHAVCKELLPRGYFDGTNWRVGSVHGESGDSLSVCCTGPQAGLWIDHAGTDEDRGDIFDLWMKVRRLQFPDVLEEAEIWIENHAPSMPVPLAVEQSWEEERRLYMPARMPMEVARIWEQGVRFLAGNSAIQYGLDQLRHWPRGTTAALSADFQIACIDYNDRPHWAFRVEYPHAMGTITVGFHARAVEQLPGERAPWFFRPNQRQDGDGIPGVPFVLEPGRIEGAKLIVITEGQWDAVTWASVAGWLNQWPGMTTVFGLRGAKSWKTFLSHWGRFLPMADFLLIPDHDEAGLQWRDEFAAALKPRARSMHFLIPPPGLDFSEWHAQEHLTASFIKDYLRSLNIAPTV